MDNIIDLKAVMEAPWDGKIAPAQRLVGQFSRLQLPGQVLIQGDFPHALEADNLQNAALRMLMGRPIDNVDILDQIIFDPTSEDAKTFDFMRPLPESPF